MAMKNVKTFAAPILFLLLVFYSPVHAGDCGDRLSLISATVHVIKYDETILVHGCNFNSNDLYMRIGNTLVVPTEKLSPELAIAVMTYVPVIPTNIRVEVESVIGGRIEKSNTVDLQAWPKDVPPPQFKDSWLVDGAAFLDHPPFSPGMAVTLFGSLFTASQEVAIGLPLPEELSGVSVFYDNKAAPLFYVGPSQINFMIPLEADERRTLLMRLVTTGPGGLKYVSRATPVQTVPAVPRVFMYQDISDKIMPIVTDTSWQLISADNPLKAGQYFTVFLTGLGKVIPEVVSGSEAPKGAEVINWPTVRVNGINAHVSFAGLTPGFAGLYQLNVVLPDKTVFGDARIEISSKDESTSIHLPVQ